MKAGDSARSVRPPIVDVAGGLVFERHVGTPIALVVTNTSCLMVTNLTALAHQGGRIPQQLVRCAPKTVFLTPPSRSGGHDQVHDELGLVSAT
jgi:hypothetical protein